MSKKHIALAGAVLFLAGVGAPTVSVAKSPCHSGRSGSCAVGLASWYGGELEGQPTASGEPFDPDRMTAAHPTLPFQTRLHVVNLANGRSVTVRVNDRGPNNGRILDLSEAAARQLGMKGRGFARV